MKIDRKNYEIWFLDYYEGRLTPEAVRKLMTFLELHHDMKKEFDNYVNISLPPAEPIIYEEKEKLKKPIVTNVGDINESNYAEYFVAAMEGDLASQQRSELKEFLDKNPHLYKEYKLFGHTKLTVDTAIAFNRKQQLKKSVMPLKAVKRRHLYYSVSAAASVILILAVYFLLPEKGINTLATAHRSDIIINRTVRNNPVQSANIIVYHSVPVNNNKINIPVNISQKKGNNIIINSQSIPEFRDFRYTSAQPVKQLPENPAEVQVTLTETNVYEYLYTIIQKEKGQDKGQGQDESGFLSLKELALFKLKRSITPEEKRDKISPHDSKITLWDIADAGVNRLNKLSGVNARLDHKDDNSAFSFALGNMFEVSGNREK